MTDELLIERDDAGTCVITLNRPDSMNAAGPSMLFALTELAESLAPAPQQRRGLLRGLLGSR